MCLLFKSNLEGIQMIRVQELNKIQVNSPKCCRVMAITFNLCVKLPFGAELIILCKSPRGQHQNWLVTPQHT